MSGIALRQALGRAARALGTRAESTAARAGVATAKHSELSMFPSDDPIMRPYYERLAKLQVVPAASPKEASPSELQVGHRRLGASWAQHLQPLSIDNGMAAEMQPQLRMLRILP